ncbi:SDR family oxidoreductase [Elusimicrobiota bacterium]
MQNILIMTSAHKKTRSVLVAGASGFVGGGLVRKLLESGYKVRCLVRRPELFYPGAFKGAEIVKGDVFSPDDLTHAFKGVDCAYYLVHSMARSLPNFAKHDARAADNFSKVASSAGVKRIIYLGGLGKEGPGLSEHLKSRHEVGIALRKHGVAVTEFRAGVIVGSGSVPFEVIRHLVERLPFLPSFPCLKTKCQPIAVRDVWSYLIEALDAVRSSGNIFEIGGSRVYTYEEMLRIYAKVRGIKRFSINLPCSNSSDCGKCAKWLGRLTPVDQDYAKHLLESLKNDVVCNDKSALDIFQIKPLDYETAVQLALKRIKKEQAKMSLRALLFPRRTTIHSLRINEGMLCDERVLEINAPAQKVFEVYSGIGGERGWFYRDWMWALRGSVDRLFGGVGMKRGRGHPDILKKGDSVDFWKVERIVSGRALLLRAEMKMPGPGWLHFESIPDGDKRTIFRQTAYFKPSGIFGNLYWNALYPIHKDIFAGLAEEIAKRSRPGKRSA